MNKIIFLHILASVPFLFIVLSIGIRSKKSKTDKEKYLFFASTFIFIGLFTTTINYVTISIFNKITFYNNLTIRFIDVFSIIAAFYYFLFLCCFINLLKKYQKIVFIHMIVTLILIILGKYEIITKNNEYALNRLGYTPLPILLFYLIYQGVAVFSFWKLSKAILGRLFKFQAKLLSFAAIMAVFAYLSITFKFINEKCTFLLDYFSLFFAVISGTFYYFGLIFPKKLITYLQR